MFPVLALLLGALGLFHVAPALAQSTNADLSALTAGSSTSSTGTFTNFSIGSFARDTAAYMATVANDQTHVELTPTVADT